MAMGILGAIIFGAAIGSFVSMCIYRIPVMRARRLQAQGFGSDEDVIAALVTVPENRSEDLSLNRPRRSFCPKCGQTLRWWHNIPVISWLSLGGKCAFCKNKILLRYPAAELLTALCSLLSFAVYGPTLTGIIVFMLCAALIVISFIDAEYYIIPDLISIPGFFIAAAIAVINEFTDIFAYPIVPGVRLAGYGLLTGGGVFFFISEVYLRLRGKEGLGLGDVKLLAMLGTLLGPVGAIFTIFVGSVLGSVIGVLQLFFSGKKFSQHLPFGPYLAVAALGYIFVGPDAVLEYIAAVVLWLQGI